MQKLKFGKSLPPGRALGEVLAEAVGADGSYSGVDALVPVPLHPRRLAERGFNQAVELALPVARATGLPLLARAGARTRHSPPQSTLTGRERRRNLDGAFRAGVGVEGLRVAIIDDVYTTGATIGALAHALLAAGAARVEAWCVARAISSIPG